MDLLKWAWRKLRRRRPQRAGPIRVNIQKEVSYSTRGATFLKQAMHDSMADAAQIIEQRIREAYPFPVRTGGLRQSISFSGTHAVHQGYPTGTHLINPWGLPTYAKPYPISGRRSYIETWPCSWCERLNGAQLIACADCGGPKGTENLPIRSIPRDWQCSWCLTKNQPDPFKCDKCGSSRTL